MESEPLLQMVETKPGTSEAKPDLAQKHIVVDFDGHREKIALYPGMEPAALMNVMYSFAHVSSKDHFVHLLNEDGVRVPISAHIPHGMLVHLVVSDTKGEVKRSKNTKEEVTIAKPDNDTKSEKKAPLGSNEKEDVRRSVDHTTGIRHRIAHLFSHVHLPKHHKEPSEREVQEEHNKKLLEINESMRRFSKAGNYQANERTMLAWIRTALAAIRTAFAYSGKVEEIVPQSILSITMAVIAVLLGFAGIIRHNRYKRALDKNDIENYSHASNSWLGALDPTRSLKFIFVIFGASFIYTDVYFIMQSLN